MQMGVSSVENHEPQAQAIHADVVADRGRGDPLRVLLERHGTRVGVDRADQQQRQRERDQPHDQGEVADQGRLVFGQEQGHEESGGRDEQNQIEQRHLAPPAKRIARITRIEPATTQAA